MGQCSVAPSLLSSVIELSPSLPSVAQPAKKEGASQLEKASYSELLLSVSESSCSELDELLSLSSEFT